jgi:hypothetical protein
MIVIEYPSIVGTDGLFTVFDGIYIVQTVDLLLDVVHFFVLNLCVQVQKPQNLQLGQNVLTSFNSKPLYALCLGLLQFDVHFHLNYSTLTLY